MSTIKLAAAKELLQEKKYLEACVILESIPDNATAKNVLEKLNKLYPFPVAIAAKLFSFPIHYPGYKITWSIPQNTLKYGESVKILEVKKEDLLIVSVSIKSLHNSLFGRTGFSKNGYKLTFSPEHGWDWHYEMLPIVIQTGLEILDQFIEIAKQAKSDEDSEEIYDDDYDEEEDFEEYDDDDEEDVEALEERYNHYNEWDEDILDGPFGGDQDAYDAWLDD